MPAQWVVDLTTCSGLTGGLVERYRCELRARKDSDQVALLLPTERAAEVARSLVLAAGDGALLDPRILTFPRLAESILVANHHGSRQVTALQRELLVGDVLGECARDGSLGQIQATFDRPGTVNAVCALLDEIKRGGVPSEQVPGLLEKHAPGHPSNAPIATILRLYQQRLHDLDLYDEPGKFWNALEILQGGGRRPFEALKVLLVDGFEEFTTTQLQMLDAFAEFVESIEVRLWLDEDRRPEMTPRSHATLKLLQATRAIDLRREKAEQSSAGRNLDRLRAVLFSSSAAGMSAVDNSVQIIEAAGGVVGECRELARRLKLLLASDEGLRPNQVAIFVRSWDNGYDAALRQSLDWYGVPADFARGEMAASVPVVRAALGVLDVVVGGWRRQDVIKVLNSNYVPPLLPGEPRLSARRLEQLALEAGIIGGAFDRDAGKKAWDDGLRRLQYRLQDERLQRQQLEQAQGLQPDSEEAGRVIEDEDGNRLRPLAVLDRQRGHLERAQVLVDSLYALLRPLEQATSLAAAARAFGALVARLGLVKTAGWGQTESVAADLQGLERLSQVLREMAEAPEVLQLRTPADVGEFAACLRRACSSLRLSGHARRNAGVQVMEVADAGLQRFAVVAVCGLSDGAFPVRQRPDAFYPDDVRARLQQGLPGLRPRTGDQHEDAFALYRALAAADREVWLSYPLTEANGAPVLRSLYVDEVLRHWEGDGAGGPPPGLVTVRKQSEVVPPLAMTAHYLEGLEALQCCPQPPRGVEAFEAMPPPEGLPTLPAVRKLAEMEDARKWGEDFSIFSGALQDAEVVARVARTYGPDHIFSISQINAYAGCPMRFFLQRVLGLDAPAEPTEGTDRRDVGNLVHRILAMFFAERTVGLDGAEPLTPANLEAAQQRLDECIAAACDSHAGTVFGAQQVWDSALERIREDLHALVQSEAEDYDPNRPAVVRAVETAFGNDGSFCVSPTAGDPVKLRGRIDRVDCVQENGTSLWAIWDYKTNDGVSQKLVLTAADVQLAVYALAVQALFPGEATTWRSWGYYRVARPIGRPSVVIFNDKAPLLRQNATAEAVEAIAGHVAAIRSGQFVAQPHPGLAPCRYCDFASVCRAPRKIR